MANEFIARNGIIAKDNSTITGTLAVSGNITMGGVIVATRTWVTGTALIGYATESYVTTAINNLIDSAPGALDTLNELAAALGDDPNFATTVTTSIGTKVSKAGDTMTGNINWGTSDRGLTWVMNTDGAYIKFFNTGDGDTNSRLEYGTSDNGNEFHRWMVSTAEEMTLKSDGLRVTDSIWMGGNLVATQAWVNSQNYLTTVPDEYLTETEGDALYAPISHTHAATDITSGTLAAARLSGNYAINVTGSAATLTTARTLTIGNTGKTFNGGADVAWTLAEIGAFSAVGGTISGVVTIESTSDGILNLKQLGVAGTAGVKNAAWNYIQFLDSEGDRQGYFGIDSSGNFQFASEITGLALIGGDIIATRPWVTSQNYITASASITGNAATATTLQTARTLTIGNTGKTFNGSANVSWSLAEIGAQAALTNPVTGTGTTNYLPKFTAASTIGNSQVFDNGTNVGIGTTSPAGIFEVFEQGTGRTRGDLLVDSTNRYTIVGRLSSTTGDVSSFKVRDRLDRAYFDVNTASKYISFNPEIGDITMQIASGYGFKVNTSQFIVNATNGNVGIGTTSSISNSLLNVGGGINTTTGIIGYNTADWFTLNGKTQPHYGFNLIPTSSSPIGISGYFGISLATEGSERIRILGNGNVGIGTTSPSYKLDISTAQSIRVTGASTGYTQGSIIFQSSTTDTPEARGLGVYLFNEGTDATWFYGTGYGAGDTFLINRKSGATYQASAAAPGESSNFFAITNAGNVGIGKTNPATTLDVNGVTTANGLIISGGAAVEDAINITNGRLTLGGHNNGAGVWYEDIAGASEWFVGLSADDVNYRFYNAPAATDRVVIYANGTVQFNAYGAGLLRTNASGSITVDTNTYLTGITAAQVHGAIYTTGGDANTYTTFGIYRNYAVNGPVAGHTTIFNVMQYDGNYGFQLGADTTSSADGLYFRSKDATIGTWKQVASRQWVTAQGYATTGYVDTAIANLVDTAPDALNTLNELATALGDDPNFATTVTNSIAGKVSKSGDTMTGTLTLSYAYPRINLTDTDNDSDYSIINDDGTFSIYDVNNNSHRLRISAAGAVTLVGTINASNFSGTSSGTNTGDQTTITGNAGSATVLQTARTLTIGNTGKSFNGSANVSWTLAEIGAQPAGSYLTAEADTLATVTARGASTSTAVTFNGGVNLAPDTGIRKAGDNWIIGYSTSLPGIAIGSGTVTDKVSISSGGTQRVWFDTNGNVGIGTASPGYKLDVAGDINFTSTLKFGGTTVLSNSGADVYANIRVIRNESTALNDGMYIGYNNSGGASGHLRFYANGTNERMRIDASTGNVGIGTTSPSTKLEVGNFLDAVTNKITVAARYEYEPEFNFRLGQSGTNLDWIGAVISSGDDGNYNGKILFKTANAGRDTPTTKMVIKASGNVGIGTTSPIYKLQVAGSAYVNGGTLFIDSGQYLRWGNSNQGIVGENDSHVSIVSGGSTRQTIYADGRTYFPGLDLSISNVNSTGSANYFRGDAAHFVLGTGGTLYLNYSNTSGTTYIFGTTYINSNVVWHAGNDGAGTGLDADLLDGQQGSYYLDWTNVTNKPDPTITLAGAVTGAATMTDLGNITITTTATSDPVLTLAGDATGSATFTNLGNATLTVTVVDDSHTHDGRYYTEAESDARFVNVTGDTVTGDLTVSGAALGVISTAAGSDAFYVDGVNGRLFTVTDSLDDSLFSVNTVAGLPVIEAFADNTVNLGPFTNPVTISSTGTLSIGGLQAATQSYVDTAITNLIGGAPGALDTLNELAAAINDDASYASTITSALALKAPLASPALTGTPTAPTAATATNSTQIATTAFVKAQGYITGYTETDTLATVTGRGNTANSRIIINSTGAAGAPTLSVNTSTSSTFVHSQENLAANLTAGQHNIIVVGKTGNTKNSGYIGYYWAGAASDSNFVTIGHWGADDLFRVYGDGRATVGTNTVWHAGNDGSGSGLDADLLDGQQGSYYQPASTAITTSNIGSQSVSYASSAGSSGYASYTPRVAIEDTRAAQRTPNDYEDYRASWEFTNQITGISDWHSAMTLQGWHDNYSAWQIIGGSSTSAHENWYLRSGNVTTWNPVRRIWHSGDFTSSNVSNWNTAYGWGNHAGLYLPIGGGNATGWVSFSSSTQGTPIIKAVQQDSSSGYYLFQGVTGSSEVFRVERTGNIVTSGTLSASGYNKSNWDAAHSWGNHADYAYWNTDSVDAKNVQSAEVVFAGNVTVEGTFTESSSIRFKENIVDLESSTKKVEQLRPVRYNKIGVEEEEIGLIAEEVAEIYPEVVTYNEEGQPSGVNYTRLSVILLKSVQELAERINKLENK
jgi:hypothetical protein